eukprot:646577-Alexandrium_andersonii.AAC.1
MAERHATLGAWPPVTAPPIGGGTAPASAGALGAPSAGLRGRMTSASTATSPSTRCSRPRRPSWRFSRICGTRPP